MSRHTKTRVSWHSSAQQAEATNHMALPYSRQPIGKELLNQKPSKLLVQLAMKNYETLFHFDPAILL